MTKKQQLNSILFLFAALLPLPLILQDNQYLMHIAILALIWAIVAASWDLVMGYAGILSYGQMAFFAVGAYTTGLLTTHQSLSPYIGILLGGIVAGVFGAAIALITLRLEKIYVALVTFAAHLCLAPVLVAGRSIGTGGSQGILQIPPLSIGSYAFEPLDKMPWFYGAYLLAALSVAVIYKMIHSSYGLAFTAMRDSPVMAHSLGVYPYKYLTLVFVVSAIMTGLAGAFYAHYSSSISPKLLGLDTFLTVFGMLIIGGRGKFPGAILGAIVVTVMNEFMRGSGLWRPMFFGIAIMVIVMYLPGGLIEMITAFGKRAIRICSSLLRRNHEVN